MGNHIEYEQRAPGARQQQMENGEGVYIPVALMKRMVYVRHRLGDEKWRSFCVGHILYHCITFIG